MNFLQQLQQLQEQVNMLQNAGAGCYRTLELLQNEEGGSSPTITDTDSYDGLLQKQEGGTSPISIYLQQMQNLQKLQEQVNMLQNEGGTSPLHAVAVPGYKGIDILQEGSTSPLHAVAVPGYKGHGIQQEGAASPISIYLQQMQQLQQLQEQVNMLQNAELLQKQEGSTSPLHAVAVPGYKGHGIQQEGAASPISIYLQQMQNLQQLQEQVNKLQNA